MDYRRTNLWSALATLMGVLFLIAAVSTPSLAGGSDTAPDGSASAGASSAAAADSAEPSAPALDGAQVFAWNCGSCHSERYPKERTDAEWEMIVTHMRVRANLTAEQAAAVLRYLKANN